MLPIECIVRGHLAGSAWDEYRASGHGPRPGAPRRAPGVGGPARAAVHPVDQGGGGDHDENISFEDAVALVGSDVAEEARVLSLALYRRGAAHAAERGIIVADTKFELGFVDGRLVVADEVLTPDSSRFWPADGWQPGTTPPSFDKQPLRDWLTATGWDSRPPPPPCPRTWCRRRGSATSRPTSA